MRDVLCLHPHGSKDVVGGVNLPASERDIQFRNYGAFSLQRGKAMRVSCYEAREPLIYAHP